MRVETAKKLGEIEITVSNLDDVHLINTPDKRETYIEPFVMLRKGHFDVENIGSFTYIGGGSTSIKHVKSIGRFTSIASDVVIGETEHPTNFLSSSHILHANWSSEWPSLKELYKTNVSGLKKSISTYKNWLEISKNKVIVGNDVWIGRGAFISRGVVIGDGAIVAANAVVTKNVEPYSIVAGIPAKEIKKRFNTEMIAELLKIRWWAYGTNALLNVDLTDLEQALGTIKKNISNRVGVYCPLRAKVVGQNFETMAPPDVALITSGRALPVVIPIYNKNIELDYNSGSERQYLFEYLSKRKTIDSLIAEKYLRLNDVIGDVGANIGVTSLKYLELGAKHVHAFEADSRNYQRLDRLNIEELSTYNITISNKIMTSGLFLSSSNNQVSSFNENVVSQPPGDFTEYTKESVQTVTLDSLNLTYDFLKIDVEGHEYEVLQGGQKLFASNEKPRLIQVEITSQFISEIIGFMKPFYNNVDQIYLYKNNEIKAVPICSEAQSNPLAAPPTYIFYN